MTKPLTLDCSFILPLAVAAMGGGGMFPMQSRVNPPIRTGEMPGCCGYITISPDAVGAESDTVYH